MELKKQGQKFRAPKRRFKRLGRYKLVKAGKARHIEFVHQTRTTMVQSPEARRNLTWALGWLALAKEEVARQMVREAERFDRNDDSAFSRFVRHCSDIGLTKAELAAELNVAPSTVSRWASAEALPARYARPVIAKRIAELVTTKLESHSEIDSNPQEASTGEGATIDPELLEVDTVV